MPRINVSNKAYDLLMSIPYDVSDRLIDYSIKQLRQATDNAAKHAISFEMALDQLTTESKNHAI